MPRAFQMTWDGGARRWHKMIFGRRYNVGCYSKSTCKRRCNSTRRVGGSTIDPLNSLTARLAENWVSVTLLAPRKSGSSCGIPKGDES
jgi:hypothetical protein